MSEQEERLRQAVPAAKLALDIWRHELAAGLSARGVDGVLEAAGPLLEPAALAPPFTHLALELQLLSRTGAAEAELARVEQVAVAAGPRGPVPLRAVSAAIAAEPDRERRLALAQGGLAAEASLETARADLVERRRDAVAEIAPAHQPDPALLDEARRLLDATSDALHEALGWAARRWLGPGVAPGGALEAADVDWLLSGQAEGSPFPAGASRLHAIALLEGMELSPRGRGIKLDDERRPGKLHLPLATRLDDAGSVAAAVHPSGTPWDLGQLLEAVGRAIFLSDLAGAELERRHLHDPALPLAFGLVLSRALLEPELFRRVLRASRSETERAVRLLALGELVRQRRACARLLSGSELRTMGPGRAHAEAHAALLRQADGARHDPRGHLREVGWPIPAEVEIRARAHAGRVVRDLRDRVSDDWFRNPRTGPYLKDPGSLGDGGRSCDPGLSHAPERPLELLA